MSQKRILTIRVSPEFHKAVSNEAHDARMTINAFCIFVLQKSLNQNRGEDERNPIVMDGRV